MAEAGDFDLVNFASQFDVKALDSIPTQNLFKAEDGAGEFFSFLFFSSYNLFG